MREAIRRRNPAIVARYLRERVADRVAHLDDGALHAKALALVERARERGIEVAWDQCRFARLELVHGPEFDARCDWAREALAREDLTPTARVDRLEFVDKNYLQDR
jgi:hypothetical protein